MSEITVLHEGFALGESPRWHDGRLWFADWTAGDVVAIEPGGTSEVITSIPGFPFSIDWLPDGRLLIISGREGKLLTLEADGTLATYADLSALGDPPWNELVVDGRGNAYVNNTGFNFPVAEFRPGSVAVVTPDGAARRVADGFAFPNGMAVTPDGATLLVAESYAGQLTALDIQPDGGLTNQRVWAAVEGSAPDGICVDSEGTAWFADVPNQSCVRVREGGVVLERIALDRGAFACMLGGTGGRTLFIVTAEWRGPAAMAEGGPRGRIVTASAPAPAAGWPAS